jgi:hypothetical protein
MAGWTISSDKERFVLSGNGIPPSRTLNQQLHTKHIMKKITSKLIALACIGAAQFAAGTAGATTLIYSDTFSTAGTGLGGTTPTVTSGLLGGTSGATWVDPHGTGGDGGGWWNYGSPNTQGWGFDVAYLPFTAQSGQVYTLSANLTSGGWGVNLGFMQTTGAYGGMHQATDTGNCPLVGLAPDSTMQTFNKSIDQWPVIGHGTQGSLYSITLDTTGANWTFSFSGAGITDPTKVYTLAANSITAIGIGSAGDNTKVGNLTLTAVPEPGAYALLLGGVGMLTMFRRRR